MVNHFQSSHKLREKKRREDGRIPRSYGPAASACARLRAEHARLNPFQLARDIERQKMQIEKVRPLRP
jgi:hypothetical protein